MQSHGEPDMEPAWPQAHQDKNTCRVSPVIQCIASLKLVPERGRHEAAKRKRQWDCLSAVVQAYVTLKYSCNFNVHVLYRSINWGKKTSKFNICMLRVNQFRTVTPSLFKEPYCNTKKQVREQWGKVVEKTPTCLRSEYTFLQWLFLWGTSQA